MRAAGSSAENADNNDPLFSLSYSDFDRALDEGKTPDELLREAEEAAEADARITGVYESPTPDTGGTISPLEWVNEQFNEAVERRARQTGRDNQRLSTQINDEFITLMRSSPADFDSFLERIEVALQPVPDAYADESAAADMARAAGR
jgi:di/tripeptidase